MNQLSGETAMQYFRIALAAICVTAVQQVASAADMPVKAAPPAPATVIYNWYGFYIGGHVGYGWGRDAITFQPGTIYAPAFAAGFLPSSLADDPKGILGGIQYGSNWQFNRLVLGLESDFSFSDIKATQTIVSTIPNGVLTSSGDQKLSWFSTTRGRVGYTITDNLLLYGTGGLAAGRANATSSFLLAGCPVGNCIAGTRAKTLWGWTAGGGLEYGIGHWSVRIEYLHYDLGDLNYTMTDASLPLPGAFINTSTKFSGEIVRAGFNYRFDWTPMDLLLGRRGI
jgi:outer membrane immunogenic protein